MPSKPNAEVFIPTKTDSVGSEPTTLEKSPKLAAQSLRTWKRGSTQREANRSKKRASTISLPISGAILLKSCNEGEESAH